MNCPIHGDVYIGWRWVEFHFLSCIAVSRILCEPYFWAIPRVVPCDDGDIKVFRGLMKTNHRTIDTDNGSHDYVEHLLCSGQLETQLLDSYRDKDMKANREGIHELSRLANLPLR